ncbi:MAG: YtxH domain-containing protein [Cyclobacteriaceae bacterium]
MSKKSTFFAFLSGATIGAILGILYAPDKGRNTRDKLLYMLDKYRGQLEEMIDQMMEDEPENLSDAKREGRKVITDAKVKAEKLLEDVDDLIGQIKSKKK